jgi:hypothetical protein
MKCLILLMHFATIKFINPNREGWRLFTDPPKLNLKAILFHNGQYCHQLQYDMQSIRISHDKMKLIGNCINCNKYQFQLCGGLKVVTVFL